ncbi:hypothetical protein FHW67_002214 [Herbaspirillum sp. Sphag1AN]|nr:hypothetical protein [Herbaspirillum sp. Sphag1AN]MBB3246123.1 hypothetical protein [Herbaspirillum sp. Sphag64]
MKPMFSVCHWYLFQGVIMAWHAVQAGRSYYSFGVK